MRLLRKEASEAEEVSGHGNSERRMIALLIEVIQQYVALKDAMQASGLFALSEYDPMPLEGLYLAVPAERDDLVLRKGVPRRMRPDLRAVAVCRSFFTQLTPPSSASGAASRRDGRNLLARERRKRCASGATPRPVPFTRPPLPIILQTARIGIKARPRPRHGMPATGRLPD
jgi:hypothetical protein